MVIDSSVDRAIERAVARAHDHGTVAKHAYTVPFGYTAQEYYWVGSFSQPSKKYLVTLSYTAEGITAVCNCTGGNHGLICKHVAAALEAAECLTAAVAEHPEANEPSIVVHPSADTWLDRVMRGEV